ncbi:MAG: hypothetical protein ABSA33_06430, partial [Candidatus Micrarchaeaceae archaeon]
MSIQVGAVNPTGKIFPRYGLPCGWINIFFDIVVDAFFEGSEITLVDGFDVDGIGVSNPCH